MSFENNDLERALEVLKIVDVWHEAYGEGILSSPAPAHDGLVESPFRDDGKKGSFSICHGGRGYKDFGGSGEKGNAWKFHALCWPALTKGDRAKAIISLCEKLGHFVPTPPAIPKAAPTGAAAAVDPALVNAAKAIERRDRRRAAEEAVYDRRDRLLHASAPKRLPDWPDFVAKHFAEGIAHLREPAGIRRLTELSASRGWPEAWTWELVDRDLLSYPWERWARPGEKWAARQRAFVVQAPVRDPVKGACLRAVGYHQLFYEPAADGRPENKGWLYLPSLPKWKPRSQLEEQLDAYGVTLEIPAEPRGKQKPALIAPLPFVLGDLVAPRLIVLLEGQWDAITFFGACGWFHDTTPAEGVAVFGIRGVQGIDAFLSYWGDWLQLHKPRAWLIADNDAAGGAWREAPPAQPGLPRPPGLAERLEAAGARKGATIVSWLKPGSWGKDFNDYYRAAKPSPLKMLEWMQRLGIFDSKGGFA